MKKQFVLSPGPHIFTKATTPIIMKSVLMALLPVIIASVYFFRLRAIILLATCIASCIGFEYIFERSMKKKITIRDYSAAVSGILLALLLPPQTPFWVCIVGSFTAIILAKQIFGGLGYSIFNPALLGRAFLMAAFPVYLTRWSKPLTLDAITGATPLALFKFDHVLTGYARLVMGNVSGSLGETSAVAIIIGAIYLFYKKIIDYRIPLSYLLTVALIGFITNSMNSNLYPPFIFHVFAGGFLLGALFMATEPVTSPVTKKGRWIFGIGCGVMTMVIRLWGGLPEGVMYSILLMNAFTPLINKATRPRRYGTK